MVKTLTYRKQQLILDTWELLRRLDNYPEIAGVKLYRKFFTRCPKALELFGWPIDIDTNSKKFLENPIFIKQATVYIKLLDTVVDMLGPDIEMLGEILQEMGHKHRIEYGVEESMYGPMGDSLVEVLWEMLGSDDFPVEAQQVWLEVWHDMSEDMTHHERKGRALQRSRLATQMSSRSRTSFLQEGRGSR